MPSTSNIIYWDEQRRMSYPVASSRISSPREIAPLSLREISASLSPLDSVWQNLRDSIVMESILSSKGQFASSKLSINRDTLGTHRSVVMIKKDLSLQWRDKWSMQSL